MSSELKTKSTTQKTNAFSEESITPNNIVEKLVSKIPESILASSTTLFLDPCCGRGSFVRELFIKLRSYGHSDENISKRIYAIDKSYRQISYFKKSFRDKIRNISIRDFEEIKGEQMKFDVIIGNPPYQENSNKANNVKLWPKFINKSIDCLNENGMLIFVTPDSWLTSNSKTGISQRKKWTKSLNIISVENTDAYWKESQSIGVSTGYFVAKKESYKNKTLVKGYDDVDIVHDLKDPFKTIKNDEKPMYDICNKIISYSKKISLELEGNNVVKDDLVKVNSGCLHEIYFSGDKLSFVDKNLSSGYFGKYVFPFSSSYKKHFWTDKPVGMLNMYIRCSKKDAALYNSLMNLNIVKFLCENYNKTAGFTPAIKNSMLPDFLGLTNADAYSKLGLSQSEINFIESKVK
jgi:hypothetical protein